MPVASAHPILAHHVEAKLRSVNAGTKTGCVSRTPTSNAATLGIKLEVLTNGGIQLPGAQGLLRVPLAEDLFHHQFDMVKVRFGLHHVIDPVVARFVEFFVVHARVVAIMDLPGGFYQAVGHGTAGGDQGVDQATITEIADDQALLGHGHGAGKGHHNEAVAIAGHSFKHVHGFAKLAAGEGSISHGAHQIIHGFDLAQIEREDGRKFVAYRIMQLAVNACAFLLLAQCALSLVGLVLWGQT